MNDHDLHRLVVAPELVVIDLVDNALVALEHALLAAHPALDLNDGCHCEEHPIQRRARAVVRRAHRLNRALDNYRIEADEILDELPSSPARDDIPF